MKTRSTLNEPSITIRMTVKEAMDLHEMLYRAHCAYMKNYRLKHLRGPQDVAMAIHRTIAKDHPVLFPWCFGFPAEDSERKAEHLEPLAMDAPENEEEIQHHIQSMLSTKEAMPDWVEGKDYDPSKEPKTVVREVHHHHYHEPRPKPRGWEPMRPRPQC